MICKFCGNIIEDTSDFCFICGQKVAEEAAVEEAFVEAAPAPVAEEAVVTAEAPVAAQATATVPEFPAFDMSTLPQGTPIYAQTAPVYAHQVFIQQITPAAPATPFVQVNGQNLGGKSKAKDPSVCSKAKKFFAAFFGLTFILQFISWIWYSGAKKQGFPKKAEDILNSTMIGLCICMVAACGFLIFKFVI